MLGLAEKAWGLACRRVFSAQYRPSSSEPVPRHMTTSSIYAWPVSREYYRIIDRISAGKAP